MKEISIVNHLIERDGQVCGICKGDISGLIEAYRKYDEFNKEIKRRKRAMQREIIDARKKVEIDIDHIMPRSLGGSYESDNLQLADKECNRRKGSDYAGLSTGSV